MIEVVPVVPCADRETQDLIRNEISEIHAALKKSYETPYGALHASFDDTLFQQVAQLVATLEEYQPDLLVLCGIGGSSMGTRAVVQALGIQNERAFLCVDTLDEVYLQMHLDSVRECLQDGQKVILACITKSGTTSETIINSAVFLELLKEFHPDDYQKYCVAITDNASPLYKTAQAHRFHILEIPQQIGGRYSVFTAVGLFPLMMLGIDVARLRSGAQKAIRTSLDEALEVNDTAQTALYLFEHYQAGYQIHTLFVFSPFLLDCAGWYKQLIGESLAKRFSLSKERVERGFTPVVSLGTTDLHSVVQLYLAGPRTAITSFITFSDEPQDLRVPKNELSLLIDGMPERTVTSIKSAIVKGTCAAFKQEKRPYISFSLEQNAESLGAFFGSKMVETILLARLFSVNPFDQPAVELYKQETRDILSRS